MNPFWLFWYLRGCSGWKGMSRSPLIGCGVPFLNYLDLEFCRAYIGGAIGGGFSGEAWEMGSSKSRGCPHNFGEQLMTKKRSFIVGMTDYSGFSLDEMISHLCDWKETTTETIETLKKFLDEVNSKADRLDRPDDIKEYINTFIDLFERFVFDFQRLLEELPKGVRSRHIKLLEQLFTRSEMEDRTCATFKKEHICIELKDEALRTSLIDEIYRETRGMLHDYRDLSNLYRRLETFVEDMPEKKDEVDLGGVELKPNFFGLGVNLNPWIKKMWEFLNRSKIERK